MQRLRDSRLTGPAEAHVTRQVARQVARQVSGLDAVIEIDPVARTALVQGMCTYATLAAAAAPHGLKPSGVPRSGRSTLGSVVTALGASSTSLRQGLPHESVREFDVLTDDGRLVACAPGDALFDAMPYTRGVQGLVVRLLVDLEPAGDLVGLRHLRYRSIIDWLTGAEEVAATGSHAGLRVDAVDGIAFATDDLRLTLATFEVEVDGHDWHGQTAPSQFRTAGEYRTSVRQRLTDLVTPEQYLWRWESAGPAHPVGAGLERWKRSRLRWWVDDHVDSVAGRAHRDRVAHDVAVPGTDVGALWDGLAQESDVWPVWMCPFRVKDVRGWPEASIQPERTYVQFGLAGSTVTSGRLDAVENAFADSAGQGGGRVGVEARNG